MKHWTFRQFAIAFLILGASGLAYVDQEFRESYSQLCIFAIGGYFGQLKPQGDYEDYQEVRESKIQN